MKLSLATLSLFFFSFSLAATTVSAQADSNAVPSQPDAYINEHFGFNVPGYKYNQAEFPCDIDKILVKNIIDRASKKGITIEAVNTADKINNGVLPVLAIDIEQLVLGEEKFGTKQESNLPRVQISTALVKSADNFTLTKHTCSIARLQELTPSSDILDLGSNGATVCSATRKCLRDLSKDVVKWLAPQISQP